MVMIVKEKEAQLNLLYELLTYVLSNGNDPANVGRQALLLIQNTLPILRGEICYFNEHQQLELLATIGYEEIDTASYEGWVEQRLEQQLIKEVLESGKGVTIPDINCQDAWAPIPGLDKDICSIAVFPLTVTERIMGVMTLLSDQTDYFTEKRAPFLTAVASSIALTLHNALLLHKVQTGESKLRLLATQLLNAQEDERRMFSRRLHDEAGQSLTTLQMHLLNVESELSVDDPGLDKLVKARQFLSEIMLRLSHLAYTLHPPELDTLGLNAALSTLCHEFAEEVDFSITYSGTDSLPVMSEAAAISFFRCLQEALVNAATHAQATRVDVSLRYDEQYICLQIRDDGLGLIATMNTAVGQPGVGLIGIKERFENQHGFMNIASSDTGKGTILVVGIPRTDTDTQKGL